MLYLLEGKNKMAYGKYRCLTNDFECMSCKQIFSNQTDANKCCMSKEDIAKEELELGQ